MAIRKDGIDTRQKLLEAAAAVFAYKGYRKATVGEICRRAGANSAAINYHFGSKDALYSTVWRNAFEEAMTVYSPTGGLPASASAQERLYAMIYSHLHRILDDGRLGHAGKILLQEMSNPSAALREVRRDVLEPLRQRTRTIISDLLGERATEQDIGFCEMSVIHQCLSFGFRGGKLPPYIAKGKPSSALIEALVEHITRFSIAGIAAVRADIERRTNQVHSV